MILAKNIFLFLYTTFLISTLSNAGVSISVSLLCVVIIYLYVKNFKKILWPDKTFLAIYIVFFGSLLLSAVISGDLKSISETIKYIYWTLPFWVVYLSEKRSFSIESWGYGTSLSLLVVSVYSVYQFITLPLGTRITGTFANPNGFVGVLETSLPILIAFYWSYGEKNIKQYHQLIKYILLGIIGMTVFVLLATQSRGGIAGAFIGGIVVFLMRYRNKIGIQYNNRKNIACALIFAIAVSGVAFLGLSTFQRSYDNERMLLIQSSYAMWKDNPVYGVGFSNWKEQYQSHYISPMAKEPDLPMPHNNVAFFFSTTGIIGGIGYIVFTIGLLLLLIKKIVKYPQNVYYQAALWSFIAISVHGFVDSGITNKFNMQILFLCLGIAFASENNKAVTK